MRFGSDSDSFKFKGKFPDSIHSRASFLIRVQSIQSSAESIPNCVCKDSHLWKSWQTCVTTYEMRSSALSKRLTFLYTNKFALGQSQWCHQSTVPSSIWSLDSVLWVSATEASTMSLYIYAFLTDNFHLDSLFQFWLTARYILSILSAYHAALLLCCIPCGIYRYRTWPPAYATQSTSWYCGEEPTARIARIHWSCLPWWVSL
jgi:hypothetical protein